MSIEWEVKSLSPVINSALAHDGSKRVGRETQGPSKISIVAVTNFNSIAIVNFKGDYTRSSIPGEPSGFVLYIPYSQAPTGGGIDGAREMMSVHLGHWGSPAATKASDGSENIRVPGRLQQSAPLLPVENLRIRIEANPASRCVSVLFATNQGNAQG